MKATKTGQIFPHKYIEMGSYASSPNQREEVKAYRDDDSRNLTRVTASGMKSKIEFSTIQGMSLTQKVELMNFFANGESDHKQQKIELEYWNDDTNSYKTGTFYRSNTDYKIIEIEQDNIYYDAIEIKLVEY